MHEGTADAGHEVLHRPSGHVDGVALVVVHVPADAGDVVVGGVAHQVVHRPRRARDDPGAWRPSTYNGLPVSRILGRGDALTSRSHRVCAVSSVPSMPVSMHTRSSGPAVIR